MRIPIFVAMFALAFTASATAGAVTPTASPPTADVNAGATPMEGQAVYLAFHEKAGVDRVVARLVALYKTDPRLKDIFAAADDEHLKTVLAEQICYVIGGPCHYSGQDMKTAHANMGVQTADFNALVADLQTAMDAEKVPFWAQNRLLAKLAPMKHAVVTR